MAKVEKKKVESKVPEGMTAKDLSVQKRTELCQEAFNKFQKEIADDFGFGLGAEIIWTPRAAVPRIVLVDLLQKENDKGQVQKPKV